MDNLVDMYSGWFVGPVIGGSLVCLYFGMDIMSVRLWVLNASKVKLSFWMSDGFTISM